ncbi:hypothetical protein [Saccharothrix xinjiangensis]|uniref:Uncharacterized protein n=1 Tax=Saccharothrix xinjiangensis TaxID=204798 RepID=A0ABV9YFB6_9PSEU
MGSRAPNAETAYRRALRLDDRGRALTDAFGWSALLLGDGSAVAREFAEGRRTGVADPVRFASFPGAGGSGFARRLGVEAHVPCLVVCTDVEDRRVHVLPLADREADEAHRRVQGWVDEFHAANRERLERWTGVERELRRLADAVSGPLWAARIRLLERRRDQRVLDRLAALLASPPDDLAALDAVLADTADLPWPLVDALRDHRRRIAELEGELAARRRMAATAAELRCADDRGDVRRLLASLTADAAARRALSPGAASALAAARTAFTRDDAEGARRWREENGPLFALPVFTAARHSWHWIAEQGRAWRETPQRHRQRDFAVFNRVLAARPLADPGAAADAVLAALAAHHGVTDEEEWTTATAGFRTYLVDSVGGLAGSAPPGFTLVGHCLPNHPPPVRPLDDGERDLRDELARGLARDATARNAAAGDLRAALAAVPALAERYRAEPAARLEATATPPELGGRAEAEELARLAAVLDEYDDAVRSATRPHESDPAVIPVECPVSPAEAAGARGGRRAVDGLREQVARTLAEHREAASAPAEP